MAVKALKELRELIHCCLTDGIPGKHKVNKTKTRLADIHQEARDKCLKSKYVRHIDDIQQLLALVDETFREIRDYDLEKSPEIIRFLSIYLSVLDAFNETTTVSFPASSAAAAHAGKLITDGRKLLRSFRTDHLSRTDNLPGGMTLLTLYSRFETWLSETKKLSGNFCIIPKDGDMGGRNAPAFPVDKMDEDFNELIKEAALLKKDFLAFPQSPWYRYSPRHKGYAFWKQKVLRLIKYSFGEQSFYYINLAEVEKNYSESMPSTVFSTFIDTLNKARYAPRVVSPVVYGAGAVPPPPPPPPPPTFQQSPQPPCRRSNSPLNKSLNPLRLWNHQQFRKNRPCLSHT
ncbi:MAG: hypothetical protein PHV36_14810 [Elusimicrobiales bacterium]|nr:hypothetical protein [Elusimicrobiales bacterium]